MSPLSKDPANVKRRLTTAALRRGHTPGPFGPFEDSPFSGGQISLCTVCGGQLLALDNGETSVPRLCLARPVHAGHSAPAGR